MATKDLFNNIKTAMMATPAVQTTTLTSAAVSTAGYQSAVVLFDVGNSADTLSGSVYWTLSLTECATLAGSYTAVAAANVIVDGGTLDTTSTYVIDAPLEDTIVVKFGYRGSLGFIKGVATATGTHSTGTPIGIISVLGDAHILPVS